MSLDFSREWWAERLPLITAYVNGEDILFEGRPRCDPSFGSSVELYSIAPKTIMVNGFEVPAPETVAPAVGAPYYMPDPVPMEMYTRGNWTNHAHDTTRLTREIVYRYKDHAIARAKAMLGIDPAEDCK